MIMPPASTRYEKVADQDLDDPESCDQSEETFEGPPKALSYLLWTRLYTYLLHSITILISVLSLGLYWQESASFRVRCWDAHNSYSPAGKAVRDQPYQTLRFEGSLWHESPYKGPPSPAVNAAWREILEAGIFAVKASDLRRVGHHGGNLSTAVRFPSDIVDPGPDGEDGYMVTTVGTHQLHCLHYLWQDHYQTYFPEVQENIQAIPEMYERHYEHCVDYIRQSLLCTFDTNLVTYDWVRNHQSPTPNSNSIHKCVNYDVMKSWLKAQAISIPLGFKWEQPPGQMSLSENP